MNRLGLCRMNDADALSVLHDKIRRMADDMGAPADLIPTIDGSDGNGRPQIEFDGRLFHYVVAERGQELKRISSRLEDEILFQAFRSIADELGARHSAAYRVAGQDFRRAMFGKQVELLRSISVRWAERAACENARVLTEYPFEDSAE